MPDQPSYGSRVLGCLLGGAIGDALGNVVEFDSLERIRQRHGPDGLSEMPTSGKITDDTQMTLFTVEGLIRAERHGGGVFASVGDAYLRWLDTQRFAAPPPPEDGVRTGWLREQAWLYARRAPGSTCLSGLMSGRRPPQPPPPGGAGPINPHSKGCGTVMRSAPFGLLPSGDVFDLAARCSALTHGHPTAGLSAGALALIVNRLTGGDELAKAVQTALDHLAEHPNHEETANALHVAVRLAAEGTPTPEAVESLGEGWIAEEALAIAVYCALAGPDPRAALLLAVNHSGDSDSTGAICGNILGAWLGLDALPPDWLPLVEGRDTITKLATDFSAAFPPPS